MTEFLTTEDLVLVAAGAVGPGATVGDHGLLASAAARPRATVFGEDAYPALVDKAAALLHSLVRNHALVDGNKRLGWAATVVYCELNDHNLSPPSQDAVFEFVMAVAEGSLNSVETIAATLNPWLTPLS